MLKDRILKVLLPFPRSTSLIKWQVNQTGEWVSCDQVRKVLRELEAKGLVKSGKYGYHQDQIEWWLVRLRGE